jgi:hypothetical protein
VSDRYMFLARLTTDLGRAALAAHGYPV